MSTGKEIITELKRYGSPEKAMQMQRFFKTGKGEYGEGDRFLGIPVPLQRMVAKEHFEKADRATIIALLDSEWHEARLCGIFILNQKFTRSIKIREEKQWVDLYLSMTHRINNWDLVDSSAHIILGRWLETRDRGILYELAGSPSLWENRIAVVATLHFIRRNDLKDILRLSEKMLPHPHDLMHKATGWMLRESWKQDPAMIEKFLRTFSGRMPRTMLRYAIEKMPEERRRDFLQAGKGK